MPWGVAWYVENMTTWGQLPVMVGSYPALKGHSAGRRPAECGADLWRTWTGSRRSRWNRPGDRSRRFLRGVRRGVGGVEICPF